MRGLVIAAACVWALGGAARAGESFFPVRPLHAPVQTFEGVITSFGAGTGQGGLRLRVASGASVTLNLGGALRVDGKPAVCATPPRLGYVPGREKCAAWPPYLAVGSTKVRVRTFGALHDGERVRVVDRIEVIDTADHYGTLP